MSIGFDKIGVIRTPYKESKDAPRQPRYSRKVSSKVILEEGYQKGLKGIEQFSHIVLIFYIDRSHRYELETYPHSSPEKRGVFATRSPHRPNNIGVSVVKLNRVENNILYIENADMLDNTPLLDIKPYID